MDAEAVLMFKELVSGVELVLCLAVVGVLVPRWRQHRAAPTACAIGVFGTVAFVLAMSWFEPGDTTTGWGAVWSDVLICVLLTIPYLLVRFAWSLGALRDRIHRVLGALTVLECVVTVVLPALPEEGQPRPGWAGGYIVLILAIFALQCVVAAVGLWRTGAGQASVVRQRMRSLSTGGILLALTLVLSGAIGEDANAFFAITISLLGLVSILMFAVAFLPPPSLRLIWRQGDVAALASAERGLMTALSRDEVAATIVPVVARVFGGGGAALLDEHARPVRSVGLSDVHIRDLAAQLTDDPGLRVTRDGLLATRLSYGWLVVQAARVTPVFGDEEVVLLERVGTLVELALQRALLFDQERVSRHAAESASAELETLLYSVSHDLRSPLISVLGYLDVLRQDHVSDLSGDGAHYLERISVNAVYMQSLISDLLELSRIGRSEPPATTLDLGPLVEQVLEGARMSHPAADLRAVGPFGTVHMSDVRARQLLTNLVDNALKHGGRDDLRVTVSAACDDEGQVRLEVADDGRGVPAEYRERVLRVFERLDASRSSSGTGMGLAICKRIVDTVGGTLAIGDAPAGAQTGTTVAVSLPHSAVASRDVPLPREAPSAPVVRTSIKENKR